MGRPAPVHSPNGFEDHLDFNIGPEFIKPTVYYYNPVQKTLSSLHSAEVCLQQKMKITANKQKLSTYKKTLPIRRGKPKLN